MEEVDWMMRNGCLSSPAAKSTEVSLKVRLKTVSPRVTSLIPAQLNYSRSLTRYFEHKKQFISSAAMLVFYRGRA